MADLFLMRWAAVRRTIARRNRVARSHAKRMADPVKGPAYIAAKKARYDARRAEQLRGAASACEVCKISFTADNTPRWDHSHATGAFRGWLCHKCNVSLGLMQDSPSLLRAAALYVESRRG